MLDLHRRLASLVLDRVREALDVLLHHGIIEGSAYQPLDVVDGVCGVLSHLVLGCFSHKLLAIVCERHPRRRDATPQVICHDLHLSVPIHTYTRVGRAEIYSYDVFVRLSLSPNPS
mmetsp:Transcript_4168/g.9916  ORF Transcript_4168/g.9916 Transcript_4168/m.9916 type:complete len:116 (+) Transcript_4168:144-491(+)